MSRSTAITIVFVLIMAFGAVIVAREFRGALTRPAVQRLEHQRTLAALAAALKDYRADHRAWPDTLFQLLKHSQELGLGANRGYQYRKPAGDAPDEIVISSQAFHPAVPAGQPWGGEGDLAPVDVPAVAYVVTADLVVRELPLDEARRRSPTPPSIPVR
ncbi:MAG TPA: hypothetical protein VEL07_04365 [Planctomycetota bacterium]|nr:hypothetical protein [Planctomycetota bacterium]